MFNTMETAVELIVGELEVCDLLDDIQFLNDIDSSLKKLADNDLYSEIQIARKRKQIMEKISTLQKYKAVEKEE